MPEFLLSQEEILNIPSDLMPMPVLSDNLTSFFAWGIKSHTKGAYNHFMWLVEPGIVASQGFTFSKESIEKYFKGYRLKFWYDPDWTSLERLVIQAYIDRSLNRPWYSRLYDWPAIVGQLFWHKFQTPGLKICSDYGEALKEVDSNYDLECPDPTQVNKWLEKYPEKYKVYGRYVPD